MTDRVPVYVRQYRIPEAHKAEMEIQVKKLLEQGIIRPSSSDYNNPIILVPKKNGKLRMVTDFHQLNKKIVKDGYLPARLNDVIHRKTCSDNQLARNIPQYFAV